MTSAVESRLVEILKVEYGKIESLEEELYQLKQKHDALIVERDTIKKDRDSLAKKCIELQTKLANKSATQESEEDKLTRLLKLAKQTSASGILHTNVDMLLKSSSTDKAIGRVEESSLTKKRKSSFSDDTSIPIEKPSRLKNAIFARKFTNIIRFIAVSLFDTTHPRDEQEQKLVSLKKGDVRLMEDQYKDPKYYDPPALCTMCHVPYKKLFQNQNPDQNHCSVCKKWSTSGKGAMLTDNELDIDYILKLESELKYQSDLSDLSNVPLKGLGSRCFDHHGKFVLEAVLGLMVRKFGLEEMTDWLSPPNPFNKGKNGISHAFRNFLSDTLNDIPN